MERLEITAKVEPDGGNFKVVGRDAWALKRLIEAGANGVTPLDTPGPRWSHYIYKLRRSGLIVETIHEAHKGPFPGTHARYILRSQVRILKDGRRAA